MKPVYRPFFYEKYLHLLDDADRSEQLPSLEKDIDALMDEVKSLGFLHQFYPIILMVLLPIVFLTLAIYIKEGWTIKLLPVFALVIYLLYKRVGLLNLLEDLIKPDGPNISERLAAKFNYTAKGLEVKSYRIEFLRLFYIAFFPLVLYLLSDLVFGPFSQSESLIFLSIAYVISAPLWWYYFTAELIFLDPIKKDLQELSTYFYSL